MLAEKSKSFDIYDKIQKKTLKDYNKRNWTRDLHIYYYFIIIQKLYISVFNQMFF